MNPFWAGFFDHLKHCGRHATLFLVALVALLLVLAGLAAIPGYALRRYALPATPVLGIWLLAAVLHSLRRTARDRRHRLERPPLSVDELRKAREKLVRRTR